jgi:hypothetical protein
MWQRPRIRQARGFTDSSTSDGCGGFIVHNDTLYYFGLQWTLEEKALIGYTEHDWSIGPLECLAVAYLLQGLALFVPAGEVADLSTVHSDNASTVSTCTSLRARTSALTNLVIQHMVQGLLLLDDKDLPLHTFTHKLQVIFIPGVFNGPADALSRKRTQLFLKWLTTYDARVMMQRQDIADLPRVDMSPALEGHRLTLVQLSAQAAYRRSLLARGDALSPKAVLPPLVEPMCERSPNGGSSVFSTPSHRQ